MCLVAYAVGILHATVWNIDHRGHVFILREEKAEAAREYREQSTVLRQQVKAGTLRRQARPRRHDEYWSAGR